MNRERGATLVELMVSLALLSSIAVLSAQMVIQSTKLMGTTARATRNPDLIIATEWIRRDFYEAASVMGSTLGWNDGPLVVMAQNGGWTAMAVVEGNLVRSHAPPGTSTPDNRIILNGLASWRWRVNGTTSVEIELNALVNPQAYQNLTGAATYRVDRHTERLTLALRAKPGGATW